ncbi:hypothetical protein [Actinomyces viscosus]|uniref:hypothetical protein n=1 Tax=Actinomyces viscosus TaxID=1656 RepID=UPI0028EA3697|nr:hypothetical protein [Actinomyces viscosus]
MTRTPPRCHNRLPRRTVLRRRHAIGSALAAMALLTGTLGACSPDPSQLRQVETTALSASQVAERTAEAPRSDDRDSVPVGEDYIHVSAPKQTQKEQEGRSRRDQTGPDSSIVARYRASDNSVLWAREVTPAVTRTGENSGNTSPQEVAGDLLYWKPAGSAVVSPDGRYLSLVLRPPQMRPNSDSEDGGRPLDVAAQRTHIVVLDAASGETVRTVEVSGLILGQVLINDALAVETAENYYPAGDGNGKVAVYSLTDTSAGPTSFSTDRWLIGVDDGALLLSPQSLAADPFDDKPVTLTRVDTRGQSLGTIDGVTADGFKGWRRAGQ